MNATHALNLAIKTLVKPGGRAVISGFEHNAVLRPLHHLGAEIIVAGRRLFDPADTISAFDRAITPGTSAVICNPGFSFFISTIKSLSSTTSPQLSQA